MPFKIFIAYLVFINIVAFVMMFADKKIAVVNGVKSKYGKNSKRKKQVECSRVPESTLMMLAVMLGSVGVLLGMKMFRHKTLHKKFTVGVPLCLALNCAAVYLMWKFGIIV